MSAANEETDGGGITPEIDEQEANDAMVSQDKFRAYCVKAQRLIHKYVKDIHADVKTIKEMQGHLANYMALLSQDSAVLHDKFRTKSVARAISEKLMEIALIAGVTPVNLQDLKASIFAKDLERPPRPTDESESAAPVSSGSAGSSTTQIEQPESLKKRKKDTNDAPTSSKKAKKDKAVTDRTLTEDAETKDVDGIELPGKIFSKESITYGGLWGVRVTAVKGKEGYVYRVLAPFTLKVSSKSTSMAKASAVSSVVNVDLAQSDEKVMGAMMGAYVVNLIDQLIEKRKQSGPSYFEMPVDVPDATTATALNGKQPIIWAELIRVCMIDMDLIKAPSEIKVNAIRIGLQLIKVKLNALRKVNVKGGGTKVPEELDMAALNNVDLG